MTTQAATRLMICDCAGTQTPDAEALSKETGTECGTCHTALCTRQLDQVAVMMQSGAPLVIACGQEQQVFENLAEELDVDAPGFVDIRDRAGWSDQGEVSGPKMAALVAEALMPAKPARSVDVISEGTCLILGPGEVAAGLASRLAPVLAVTVLVTDDAIPDSRDFDVITGRVRNLSGALGGFSLKLDDFRMLEPSGRGERGLSPARNGASSNCDIVLDLTGDVALVSAPEKREGYLRADPRDPVAVAQLTFEAAQLQGTFEKPLYVRLEENLCAHSRAEQTGCTNCLDICPTGAITPAGDHVAIDPMICAGCGSCAALCPSTAITYEDPPIGQLLARMEVLSRTFRSAGGTAPRLLIHDGHGAEMIRLSARYGRGLPADVIPLELSVVSGVGHAELLAGLAHGFAAVQVLLAPRTERDALTTELALAEAICGPGKLGLIDVSDPDVLSDRLYRQETPPPLANPVLPLGNRRQITRLAARALNPDNTLLKLPENAPYGAVDLDKDACTLCLSCVSLCPSGALIDNPDLPQLNFQEDACLQCGLCSTICPESAITLKPQLDLSDSTLSQRVLNEEEPFACIKCGALFGVKSTVERIMEKLAGSHPMFASSQQARMIQMCDNCRVNAQFHSENNPFEAAPKPKVVTTEDYFSKRKDH
ncbi:4Fe-4S binding protein [Primorskyibacter sp. S87]|uniref:4Fe-4S binding protein n=1 Tax=Primorskyibacter sp. S87 TaxID=3415126 RepID=UPI003C79E9FB